MELQLTLTFACHCCNETVRATLACKGIQPEDHADGCFAAVNIPCPHCDQVCQLLFDPVQGCIHQVRAYNPGQPIPEPSLN